MHEPSFMFSFLPLIVFSIPHAFICYFLAKQKHKNVALWTVLGVIPFVNLFAVIYLIGSVNTAVEEKLDRIIELLQRQQA